MTTSFNKPTSRAATSPVLSKPGSQRGAAIAEYLPLIMFIASFVITGIGMFGQEIRGQMGSIAQELGGGGLAGLTTDRPSIGIPGVSLPGVGGPGVGGPGVGNPGRGPEGGGNSSDGPGADGPGLDGPGLDGPGTGVNPPRAGTPGPGAPGPGEPGTGNPISDNPGVGGPGLDRPGAGLPDTGESDANPDTEGDTSESGEGDSVGDDASTDGTVEEAFTATELIEYAYDLGRGAWDGIKTQFFGILEFITNPIETASSLVDLAIGLVTDTEATLQILAEAAEEEISGLLSGDAYKIGVFVGENLNPNALLSAVSKVRKLARFAEGKRKYDEGCASFTADTLIWTPEGFTAIQQLTVGDPIHNRSTTDYSDHQFPITQTFNRTAPGYYELTIAGTLVQATPEHPFWLQGQGWTKVVNLKPGNAIAAAGGDVLIDNIRYIHGATPVYNFSVDTHANYFVSPLKLWVHNTNGSKCQGAEARAAFEKAQLDKALSYLPPGKHERFLETLEQNPALKEAIVGEPGTDNTLPRAGDTRLADSWNRLDDLQTPGLARAMTDPVYLKAFNKISSAEKINQHTFVGEIVSKVGQDGVTRYSITGIHSNQAFADGTARIKPGTEIIDLGDGFYQAKVEKRIPGFVNKDGTDWKVKKQDSTFFPDSWSRERVQAEIAYAYNNRSLSGGNLYSGYTTNGRRVMMRIDAQGNLETAFPSSQ